MRRSIASLQALVLLFLCLGMAWMLFIVASIDSNPPTIMDLQLRSTQASFDNLNSTAVALAKEMLENIVPSPSGRILLPVTGGETATASPVAFVTLRAVTTSVNPLTPFFPPSSLFPATATRARLHPPESTVTNSPVPTKTSGLPTLTATNLPSPTLRTPTSIPTSTPVLTPTGASTVTPIPPATSTPKPTQTPKPTNTPKQPPTTQPPTEPPPTEPPPTNTSEPAPTHNPTKTPKPTNTPKQPPTTQPPTEPPSTEPPPTEPPPTPLPSASP